MQYIYRFDVAAIVIVLSVMITYFKNKTINTRSTLAFTALLWQCLCSSIFNVIAIILMRNINSSNIAFNYILNILYYIFFNAIPLCFYICVYYLSETNKKMPRVRYWIFFGIYIIFSLLTLSTPFTKLVFWFDENYIFHHGVVFYLYYLLAAFYTTMGLIHFFNNRSNFTSNQVVSLLFFTFACIIATIVQVIFPNIMCMGFVLSLSILVTFLSLENPDDYKDTEMPFYNKRAFLAKAQENFENHKRTYVLGIGCNQLIYIIKAVGLKNRIILFEKVSTLLKNIPHKKLIFRFSFSKIAVFLSVESEQEREEQIEYIKKKFQEPFNCGDLDITLSPIIKLIQCPKEAKNIEELTDLFEDSLNIVNSDKLNNSLEVDVELLDKRRREHKIIQILENAIDAEDFEVVYQPIYSVEKKSFTTAEALLRLKNKEIGYISPEEFIPLAEQNGMILKIGNFLFKEVCRYISENRIWEKGMDYIHVNLSVIQCMQEELHMQLTEIMDEYKIDYRYINLEVTETTAIVSSDVLHRNMDVLLKKGSHFSLDDFGTGFSNTSTLIQYPFDVIKIDKSMVWATVKDEKARNVLTQTIAMVKDLNMKVVAEGIETAEQSEMIINCGCDFIQGHFYSYPLSDKDFIRFIEEQKK